MKNQVLVPMLLALSACGQVNSPAVMRASLDAPILEGIEACDAFGRITDDSEIIITATELVAGPSGGVLPIERTIIIQGITVYKWEYGVQSPLWNANLAVGTSCEIHVSEGVIYRVL